MWMMHQRGAPRRRRRVDTMPKGAAFSLGWTDEGRGVERGRCAALPPPAPRDGRVWGASVCRTPQLCSRRRRTAGVPGAAEIRYQDHFSVAAECQEGRSQRGSVACPPPRPPPAGPAHSAAATRQ